MAEQLPQDVIARLRALDSAITPELAQASWALLVPFHEKLGYTAPRIVRDLRYGEHERHRLDVHTAGEHGGGEPRTAAPGPRSSCSCTAAASSRATRPARGPRPTTWSARGRCGTAGSA